MPITVECSGCGGRFRAPDEAAGKRVKCPKCSATIHVGSVHQPQSEQPSVPGRGKPAIPTVIPIKPMVPCKNIEGSSRVFLWAWIGGGGTTVLFAVGLAWLFISREPPPNKPPAVIAQASTSKPPALSENRNPKRSVEEPAALVDASATPARDNKHPRDDLPPQENKPGVKEKQQDASADPLAIGQVERFIKEMGFEVSLDAHPVTVSFATGGSRILLFYIYTNKATGADLSVLRSSVNVLVTQLPGSDYAVTASHEDKNQKAIMELTRKMSPTLESAVTTCLAEYGRTKKKCEQRLEKVRVSVGEDGIRFWSSPGLYVD